MNKKDTFTMQRTRKGGPKWVVAGAQMVLLEVH
jgi:hypothetical protein